MLRTSRVIDAAGPTTDREPVPIPTAAEPSGREQWRGRGHESAVLNVLAGSNPTDDLDALREREQQLAAELARVVLDRARLEAHLTLQLALQHEPCKPN